MQATMDKNRAACILDYSMIKTDVSLPYGITDGITLRSGKKSFAIYREEEGSGAVFVY